MRYEEHQRNATQLDEHEMKRCLRELALDDKFSGVVAWLEANRNNYIMATSRQEMASDHGKLAHGQGSVHALNVLILQLVNLLKPGSEEGGGIPDERPQQ